MNYMMSSLGQICEFSRGLTYKKSDEVTHSKNAVLRANNITLENGEINFDEVKYISDEIEVPISKKVKKDTLLICTASGSKKHLGKVGYVTDEIDFAFGGFMGLLTPKSEIYPKYLYWLTQSKEYSDFIMGLTDGANINNLKFSQLSEFPVPVPEFGEQKRIVAILDQAFANIDKARALTEQNLKNARELFESYLGSYFDEGAVKKWKRVKVEDVCTSIIDCINKTAPKVDYQTEYKMIRTTNVRDGLISLDNVKYVTKDTYELWTRRQTPEVGDVILTREAPMGEVGMLLSEEKVFLGQRLVSYRANPEILHRNYLLWAFQSSDVQSQIADRASGSTVQHMRVPDTKILEIPCPSLESQTVIVKSIEQVKNATESLVSIYTKKLAALDELKRSVLQKAFSGELTKDNQEAA